MAFQQTWEALGGTIAGCADFKNEDESVATQVNELKGSDADAVTMCSYPPGGAAAIDQIRAAGIDVPIAASSAFDGTFWLKGISNTDGIYTSLNGSAYDPANEATTKLFRKLGARRRRHRCLGRPAGVLRGWTSSSLDAIEETGSIDGDTLRRCA